MIRLLFAKVAPWEGPRKEEFFLLVEDRLPRSARRPPQVAAATGLGLRWVGKSADREIGLAGSSGEEFADVAAIHRLVGHGRERSGVLHFLRGAQERRMGHAIEAAADTDAAHAERGQFRPGEK